MGEGLERPAGEGAVRLEALSPLGRYARGRDGAPKNRIGTEMKHPLLRIALLITASSLVACAHNEKPRAKAPTAPPATSASPTPAAPARTAPPARPQLGDGVHWFRTSAEYRAITMSTYRAAAEAVAAGAKGREKDSWAVVLDADETVLDNSVFQRDLNRSGGPFSEELWATFVRLHSAVPVPGARAFLERVKELGGRIVIVTNRWNNLCDDTRENFRLQSLPYDAILCRVDTGDKNPRFESAATGAALGDGRAREVLAFVGDNIQDFPKLKQSLRDEQDAAFADFGRRFFVLPNPMYGSWQQVAPR